MKKIRFPRKQKNSLKKLGIYEFVIKAQKAGIIANILAKSIVQSNKAIIDWARVFTPIIERTSKQIEAAFKQPVA